MQCVNCKVPISAPVWPQTRNKFCSRKCRTADWYKRNREKILAWQAKYPRRLHNKRKYNISPKGKAAQARYWKTHKAGAVTSYLERYRNDPQVRAIQRSREISRKVLLKHRPRVCAKCGLVGETGRQVHCHHRDENVFNRKLSNLQWLCTLCHADVHAKAVHRK